MTANNDTPDTGHESTDFERGTFPLDAEPDEDLAEALEGQKQEMRSAVDDVAGALLNDSEPLTDEKLVRLTDAANALAALSETLTLRVPPRYRDDKHERP